MTVTFRPAADADIPRICSFVRNAQELFFFFPPPPGP